MTEKRFFRAIESPNVEAYIFEKPVLQIKASKDTGEEVYKSMTYIEIRIKGQTQESVRPLQETDVKRFPDAWRYYNGQEVKGATGTPISQLEGIEEGQVVAFKSRGIHFIEDLARIQPEMIQGIGMGIRALQQKAQKMTGINAEMPVIVKTIAEENATLKTENIELNNRIAGLEDKFDRLISALNRNNPAPEDKEDKEDKEDADTPEPKKRGRRKKE